MTRHRRLRTAAAGACVALASAGIVGMLPGEASAAPVTIQLLNINDFHGRIEKDTTGSNTVKFAGTIEQLRADPAVAGTALLSAGDNIGASLFPSFIAKDQPTIDVLNALGMDASAVGNHEFDAGFDDLKNRVIGGSEGNNSVAFPYLGANVYNKGTSTPALDEYEVIDVAGVSVGVIGVVTQETPTLVSPGGISTLDFGDPVDAVNRVAAQLSDNDPGNGEAQVIVAEFHDGASAGTPDGATLEEEVAAGGPFARIVTDTSANVDVIFTGHTHKQYAWTADKPGGGTRPIVQTGSYGENIGRVTLTVDPADPNSPITFGIVANVPRLTYATGQGPALDAQLINDYPVVATVSGIVDAAIANANTVGSVPKGSVTADITTAFTGGSYVDGKYVGPGPTPTSGRDDRASESTLGGLVADALVSTLNKPEYGAATIGVVNPGGMRNELLYAPDGVITYSEAVAVLPFANSLFTTTLTGAQFKTLLEQQWQRLPNGTVPARPYLQLGLSSNVTYTFDASLPEGSRITSITVDGEPIQSGAPYRIGTFSFLTSGGDNFHVFKEGTDTRDTGLVDRDAWVAYLEAHPNLAPDFARQSVEVSPLPTLAVPGQHLQFAVSKLDLTSLGSPQNTVLHAAIDGVAIGDMPVVNGAAAVDLTVPGNVPSGIQDLTLTAEPSNTVVTIPVTVPASIQPLSPSRILDSRTGAQTVDGKFAGIGIRTAGSTLELDVTGRGGVPTDATGVVLNLTATDATGVGYVTVWACGTPRPIASSANFAPGAASPNAVVTGIGDGGRVCLYTAEADVQLIADVNGVVPIDGGYSPVVPARLLETRAGAPTVDGLAQGEGPRTAGSTYTLQVTGRGNVPADAVAVALNVTATDSTGTGYVTVWSCTQPRPIASSVNFVQGDVAPNSVLTELNDQGQICLYVAEQSAQLIVDVFGYFGPGAAFGGLTPARLLETRPGAPTVDGQFQGAGPVAPGSRVELQVTGRGGVPDGATGVVLNVTATDAAGTGYVTTWPCDEAQPNASTVNFVAGVPSPNAAVVKLSAEGEVCLATGEVAAQLIVDVTAFL